MAKMSAHFASLYTLLHWRCRSSRVVSGKEISFNTYFYADASCNLFVILMNLLRHHQAHKSAAVAVGSSVEKLIVGRWRRSHVAVGGS